MSSAATHNRPTRARIETNKLLRIVGFRGKGQRHAGRIPQQAAGQVGTALIAVALCGSIIGFLVFNWPPAKIFLGDSGSLPIGFLLGALALEGSLKTATGLTLAAPLLLMSIPGFDTTMAVLRRVLNGRGIGQGDRAHLHHCLKDRGLSAVIASVYFRNDWIAVGGCAALLVVLIAGRVFGFEETRLLWRHLRHLTASSARASRVIRLQTLRETLLATSSPAPFDAWGQLCNFVEEQGGLSLELFVEESPLGNTRTLMAWHAGERHRLDRHELWEFRYRPPREGEHALGIAVASKVNAALAQLAAEHLCQLMSAFCRRQAAEVATAMADRERLVRISQEAA